MPRRPRHDTPGSWHHVFNRAIGKRTMFERRSDRRFFLANLARAVRRSELELHAYCLMGNHYHLLVRSPRGQLADAMHRVQLAYSRRFNRRRRRDGTLMRSRYGSRRVWSMSYRRILVSYIDGNPVAAGLTPAPSRFEWGSAQHYARRVGPPWLERSWVEAEAARLTHATEFGPACYRRAFPTEGWDELSELVDARIAHGAGEDLLDEYLEEEGSVARKRAVRRALRADGTRPALPLAAYSRVRRVLFESELRTRIEAAGMEPRAAFVGLARDLAGATLDRLSRDLGVAQSTVLRLYRIHGDALVSSENYARSVEQMNLAWSK